MCHLPRQFSQISIQIEIKQYNQTELELSSVFVYMFGCVSPMYIYLHSNHSVDEEQHQNEQGYVGQCLKHSQ